jgi:hypothetical protein
MLRLIAAFVLVIGIAAPAGADTSIIVSGNGFTFFSGSGGLRHFHDGGTHWRKRHQLGGAHFFHRLPRHQRLLLPERRHGNWIARHELRSWDNGHQRHWKRDAAPQVIVLVPIPFETHVKIVTVPGQPCFGTFFDRRSGTHRVVLLPLLKPGRLAFAD